MGVHLVSDHVYPLTLATVHARISPSPKLPNWIIGSQFQDQRPLDPNTRVRDLTEEQVNRLRELIDRRYKVEGDLRREVALNIKRLQEIGSYRGLRHRRNLPVRGQRTKTNARQRRGPKRTVGVRRKK